MMGERYKDRLAVEEHRIYKLNSPLWHKSILIIVLFLCSLIGVYLSVGWMIPAFLSWLGVGSNYQALAVFLTHIPLAAWLTWSAWVGND